MERVLVTILMALGIVAAVAGVMKVYYIKLWNPREATLRDWMPLFWWYRVEELGLITAACAPFLKPSIERVLCRFGIANFRFVTIGLNTVLSGQENTTKDFSKTDSSAQGASGEEQSQRSPSQTATMVSSGDFDRSRDRVKFQERHDCVEV